MSDPVKRPLHALQQSAETTRDSGRSRPVALVTGASRRVGRAVAIEFARAGLDIVVTSRERAADCAATAADCVEAARAAGHSIEAQAEQVDLSDIAAIERLAAGLSARPVGVLVHAASQYLETPFATLHAADIERLHRLEVVAPMLLAQRLAPSLSNADLPAGGAVVLFSDIYALGRPRAGYGAYLVAKSAVKALTEQLALELAPRVRVNCVAPGVVAWPPGFPEAQKREILRRTPLGRAGTEEECAQLVRFLALEASYLTGQTIAIDGGRSIR